MCGSFVRLRAYICGVVETSLLRYCRVVFAISRLWKWEGEMSRGAFALLGAALCALKYNLDLFVARKLFHLPWSFWNYQFDSGLSLENLSQTNPRFLMVMLVLAAPFVWMGVVLTVKRLRSAGLPVWLAALFFAPYVNLFFFLILCVIPSSDQKDLPPLLGVGRIRNMLDRWLPDHPVGSAAMALLPTSLLALGLSLISTHLLQLYGLGLFVGLPLFLGLTSVLLYSYHRPRKFGSCVLVALASVALVGAAMLAVAIEGIICIIMAAPMTLTVSIVGGSLGFFIQHHCWSKAVSTRVCLLLPIAMPLFMSIEHVSQPPKPLFEVKSSVIVDATPERVWRHVVTFPELPAPTEMIFRLGVAYPVRAEIQGTGPGAIRYCVFSTGSFVEPIEVWDPPRLLKFGVTANPAPMQEWTPYREIHPPHLDGFLVSRAGQFRLERLPDGRTLMEGTTWYQHGLWPAEYWHWWSDAVIHRIHLRVLRHVKSLAEASP